MSAALRCLALWLIAAAAACSKADEAKCPKPLGLMSSSNYDRSMQIMAADMCVVHWSAQLAPAGGSISELSEAVLGHCGSQIRKIGELPPRQGIEEYDDSKRDQVYRRLAMAKIAERRANECPAP